MYPSWCATRVAWRPGSALICSPRDSPPQWPRLPSSYDAERVDIARAVGVEAPSVRAWITNTYGVEVPDMREARNARPGSSAR